MALGACGDMAGSADICVSMSHSVFWLYLSKANKTLFHVPIMKFPCALYRS